MSSATAFRIDEPCTPDPSASRWLDDEAFSSLVLFAPGVVAVVAGTPALRSTRDVAARVASACARFACVSAYALDVEQQRVLAELIGVGVLPTVFLYREGAPIGRLEGLRSIGVYELAIETAVHAPRGV